MILREDPVFHICGPFRRIYQFYESTFPFRIVFYDIIESGREGFSSLLAVCRPDGLFLLHGLRQKGLLQNTAIPQYIIMDVTDDLTIRLCVYAILQQPLLFLFHVPPPPRCLPSGTDSNGSLRPASVPRIS